MTIEEVVNYVLKTPFNTNRAILTSMLQDLEGNGDGVVRRDNDYNYDKIADVFVPLKGEICLVDTASDGLRIKCGDGVTVWRDLEYIDDYVVKGYYHEGNFYKDKLYTKPVNGATQKIYIDLATRKIYFYEEGVFLSSTSGGISEDDTATSEKPGLVKLYDTLGEGVDGTMSQKAISEELKEKVEVTLNKDEELLAFVHD